MRNDLFKKANIQIYRVSDMSGFLMQQDNWYRPYSCRCQHKQF